MPVYLALRDVEPDSDGRPRLPESWEIRGNFSVPAPTWIAYVPNVRRSVVITHCATFDATRAIYSIDGPQAWLDSLPRGSVAPARELLRKALAGPGTARQMLRRWRWWRCDVTERDEQGDPIQLNRVTRELCADGVQLPALSDLPWDLDALGNPTTPQLADRRVRELRMPALTPDGAPWSMAGREMSHGFEGARDRDGDPDPGQL